MGRHFRIFTDQKSLCGLLSQTIQTPAQEKWLSKLLGFDYEIIYTPGHSNVVADALSRIPESAEALFTSISTSQPLLLEQLRHFYTNNSIGQSLLAKFQQQTDLSHQFHVQQGLLYFRNRIFVPLETGLRNIILEEHHSTPVGGSLWD